MSFWTKAPTLKPRGTTWRPGEKRTYIPVMSLGVPPNMPASGVVGKTHDVDGTQRVSFVVRGKKTEGTR